MSTPNFESIAFQSEIFMENFAMPKIRRTRNLGSLQDLLIAACPPDEKGRQSVPILASLLGMTSQALYYAIKMNRISTKTVNKIMKVKENRPGGGEVSVNDFLPYIF